MPPLLRLFFRQLYTNSTNVRSTYTSQICAYLTKNHFTKSGTKRLREYILFSVAIILIFFRDVKTNLPHQIPNKQSILNIKSANYLLIIDTFQWAQIFYFIYGNVHHKHCNFHRNYSFRSFYPLPLTI